MRTPKTKTPAFRYSPLVAALAVALAPQAQATTYVVDNQLSNGAGSLSAAITAANSNCGSDRSPLITFNIPGTGPFIIAQSPSLDFHCFLGGTTPPYTPTVDGYTQPGSFPNDSDTGFTASLQIILNGIAYGGCGINLSDSNSYGGFLTVKGLEFVNYTAAGASGLCGNIRAYGNRFINNWNGLTVNLNSEVGDGTLAGRNVIGAVSAGASQVGVEVQYGGSASIRNNFIGTLDGSSSRPNHTGILLNGGGANTISGNVISGNYNVGIDVYSDAGTSISGNKIGVDPTGTGSMGNNSGIQINNSYGGTSISGNTISGNFNFGVAIYSSDSVTLSLNKIGTDSTGSFRVGNDTGVQVQCSTNISLGSNVISGNFWNGVVFGGVDGSGAPNIFSNKIGVGADGSSSLPNDGSGLIIDSYDCSSQTGSNNNVLTNIIANNGFDGVALTGGGTGNELTRNSIYDNGVMYGGKNININFSEPAPLPNDPGDADTGPNNQQNYPTITSVVQGAGNTTVSFTMDSNPSTTFHVEIFDNPTPAAPAGRNYRADTFITTDGSGLASGSYVLSGLTDNISLTATHTVTRDTSEFSPIGLVGSTPVAILTATMLDFGSIAVGASSQSQSVTVSSVGTAPYRINTFDSLSSCSGGPFCYGGGFTCSTTCATSTDYIPGTSCSLTATFAPTFLGSQTTTVYLCDNTSASPHSITLTGNGVVPPIISFLPSQWDFGNVLVGKQSDVKTIVVHNPGAAPAVIGPLSTTGAFRLVRNNCPASIAPFDSCAGDVVFAPTQSGFTSGALVVPTTITEGDPKGKTAHAKVSGASATAPLFGTGTQGAVLSMPSSIILPASTVGGPSVTLAVQLSNTGNAVLTFSSITASAPFTLVNNCPLNLLPGDSCFVNVGFSATQAGVANGTLTVVSGGPQGSRAVPITANAQTVATPLIHVVPTFVGFGARMFGTQSDSQRITITNDGGSAATLGSLAVGVDYLLVGTTCGLTLAPASTCFADVAFRPVGFGPRPGQFTFSSNSPGSPHVVEMLGTGCRPFTISSRAGVTSACAP